MTVVALLSVKGSPGATTAAAAVAAASQVGGRPTLLVELDPSGGDLRLLAARPAAEPNLVHVAGELRHARLPGLALADQAVDVLPRLTGVAAPAGPQEAGAVVASIGDAWSRAFQAFDGTVVVDAGRWDPAQQTAGRVRGHDVVGLVVRATADSVEHARHAVALVRSAARSPVAAVVVGHRPYAPEAVAGALDLPLAGALAWDRRGAAALWARGAEPAGVRSQLVRSAARTLAGLEAQIPARHVATGEVPVVALPPPPPPPPAPPAVGRAAERRGSA
ncbi:MAG TPA: hypothetical protein VFZ77_11000 [Acidimicrobiales bacterium]